VAVRQNRRGTHMGQSARDTWQFVVGLKGATWPSHGLPRGTPLLVDRFQCKILAWSGIERVTSRVAVDRWGWANRPPPECFLFGKWGINYLYLVKFWAAGVKGRGLSPAVRANTQPNTYNRYPTEPGAISFKRAGSCCGRGHMTWFFAT
jgi:hypothetical protein